MESAKTPAHGGVPEIRFSTDDMPAQGRIAAWQEIFGRHILNVDLTPLRDEPLQSNVVAHGLPGLGLVTISRENVGFRATRTRELVSRGSEDIILTIVTNGALGFSQMGRDVVANAGEAVAVASAYTGEAIHGQHRPCPEHHLWRSALGAGRNGARRRSRLRESATG